MIGCEHVCQALNDNAQEITELRAQVDAMEAMREALREIYNQRPSKAVGGYGQLLNLPEWDRWVDRLGLVLWLAKEAK